MWPFNKRKFKVGDIVIMVDAPEWTYNRQFIGCEATIMALPQAKDGKMEIKGKSVWVWADCYVVEIPGVKSAEGKVINLLCSRENTMRHKTGDDPFAEPRDMSDDTPNKVVSWDSIPHFTPQKENS